MDENRLFNNWERALIVALQLPDTTNSEMQSSLEEMASLTYSLGGEVVGQLVQARAQIHPAYFFGKGKLDEIKSAIKNDAVDAVLVNNQLSPKQNQNLEKIFDQLEI